MGQTRTGIDNASEQPLNEYWIAESDRCLALKGVIWEHNKNKILRVKLPEGYKWVNGPKILDDQLRAGPKNGPDSERNKRETRSQIGTKTRLQRAAQKRNLRRFVRLHRMPRARSSSTGEAGRKICSFRISHGPLPDETLRACETSPIITKGESCSGGQHQRRQWIRSN